MNSLNPKISPSCWVYLSVLETNREEVAAIPMHASASRSLAHIPIIAEGISRYAAATIQQKTATATHINLNVKGFFLYFKVKTVCEQRLISTAGTTAVNPAKYRKVLEICENASIRGTTPINRPATTAIANDAQFVHDLYS